MARCNEPMMCGNYTSKEVMRFVGDGRIFQQDGSTFTDAELHLLNTNTEVWVNVYDDDTDPNMSYFEVLPAKVE